ncbi:MAG: extracellular solute-binding protein [Parcubacteria group bacterium]|nr:extracellular solute-binding protein [Parcubacteria group bacterium]
MKNMSPLQIGILLFSGIIALFSVLVFAGIIPWFGGKSNQFGGEVVLWGTIPEASVTSFFDEFNKTHENNFKVRYVAKLPDTFDTELVEALASGTGPDLIFLPQDLIVRHEDKLALLPYASFSLRQFKDMFIDAGELYLLPQGISALPFIVDPLVMYWNKDFFSSHGLAEPPRFWDEFLTLAPALSRQTISGDIEESMVAMGESANIKHTKEILSMLILQAGNPVIQRNDNGSLVSTLNEAMGNTVLPAGSALRFYTEFSNPTKRAYSWNRSLPEAKDFFIAGKLALYFGFASELPDIRVKNPHLNIDVAEVPQIRDQSLRASFGSMSGVALLKQSKNAATASQARFALVERGTVERFASLVSRAPALRSALEKAPSDPFAHVFYSSAPMSRAWLDPDPRTTDFIFKTMVDDVTSGRARESDAIGRANQKLIQLFK